MRPLIIGLCLVAMLSLPQVSRANSLMRDIWNLVITTPAPANAAELATLAGRTQALYLANGLAADGEAADFGPPAVRILAWTRFFMGPTAAEITDLQLFRLLRLADDPGTNTLAYLRGAFGTVLVSNYVAALSASDEMAVQLLGLNDIDVSPETQDCLQRDDFESVLRTEFGRRLDMYESSLVLTLGSARDWWTPSFDRLADTSPLQLDELRLDDRSVSFVLLTSCGSLVLTAEMDRADATPVVRVGAGPLSDTLIELNRYILAETSVR